MAQENGLGCTQRFLVFLALLAASYLLSQICVSLWEGMRERLGHY